MRKTWTLVKNYGNYGVYGWGFGIWCEHNPDNSERVIIAQFGPWKVMWQKL